MTKAERHAVLRNYALSGFIFGVATGAIRALTGAGVPHAKGAWVFVFVMTVVWCALVGLLIGVVVLWREKRADAKRRRLSKQLAKQDNAALRIRG
jgi:membrane associated rhomboid family serine protease